MWLEDLPKVGKNEVKVIGTLLKYGVQLDDIPSLLRELKELVTSEDRTCPVCGYDYYKLNGD